MTNSRVFGHRKAGLELAGGSHAVIAHNMIGANGNGILVRANVSDFIIQGNHIGAVFKGGVPTSQLHGVEIQSGSSDRYLVSANTMTGNSGSAFIDGGAGKNKQVVGNIIAKY